MFRMEPGKLRYAYSYLLLVIAPFSYWGIGYCGLALI